MGQFNVKVLDENGNVIEVGTRVHYWDEQPTADENGSNIGEVVRITDFDDAGPDGEGRSVPVYPDVVVKFWKFNSSVEGGREYFEEEYRTGEWEYDEYDFDDEGCPQSCDATGVCEELIVIED